ncbi:MULTISPECIES: class II aldolase/adducin family protein [Streptomyces]|jgi:3-dehydro-4-phosphotetronate decarboxylase|uniref:Class II aldolase/adducin family protein n=1 Tax=Streptomyces doudnae TaxID=3075536 RepID=A0ABD5ES44_9ACTN|nr:MULTISPECIES: class II aldolase/adducin family protein [unclassified Streptomyces]MDT0436479.1 class II aldolase/adducin family protein [Streptomyces sp. DSM 41981]MYQ63755.1 aldolase [Streptomyces sp. SID4950]SCD64766.1 Ribulose-5-phosphate 4-epimerase/Fuculose-1-phosphate aldolase [Streptomyces sp. SolWspMP-5a-2]
MTAPRDELVRTAAHLASLGLSPGSSGNLSVRDGDGRVLLTPTGADLAALDPDALSVLDLDGTHLDGPRPSKELPLHLAFYRRDPANRAVVHLHSRQAVAASCLPPWSARSALPPLTPYFVMRVGQTPLLPYAPPGDPGQAADLERLDFPCRAALLQNHGPVTAGPTLKAAAEAAVEIEEVSALLLLLGARHPRLLTPAQARALAARYGSCWTDEREPEEALRPA